MFFIPISSLLEVSGLLHCNAAVWRRLTWCIYTGWWNSKCCHHPFPRRIRCTEITTPPPSVAATHRVLHATLVWRRTSPLLRLLDFFTVNTTSTGWLSLTIQSSHHSVALRVPSNEPWHPGTRLVTNCPFNKQRLKLGGWQKNLKITLESSRRTNQTVFFCQLRLDDNSFRAYFDAKNTRSAWLNWFALINMKQSKL